jgi:hypothetical protein
MSLTVHSFEPNKYIFKLNTGNVFYFEHNPQPFIITYAGGSTMQYQKYNDKKKKGYGSKTGTSRNVKVIVFSRYTPVIMKK